MTLTGSIGLPSVLEHHMLSNLSFTSSDLVILFVPMIVESSACLLSALTLGGCAVRSFGQWVGQTLPVLLVLGSAVCAVFCCWLVP